jgi:rhodanese-related sulfurtransferase
MASPTRFIEGRLKLQVNAQKSAVARPWQRSFLGFTVTDGPQPRRRSADKAVARLKDRVRDLARHYRGVSLQRVIADPSSSPEVPWGANIRPSWGILKSGSTVRFHRLEQPLSGIQRRLKPHAAGTPVMVENVPPGRVWKALQNDPTAQLVDVRTDVEWQFVGLPDLVSIGKQAVLVSWQMYPTMQHNAAFADQLREAGFTEEHHIYFICRSGQRSQAAAQAAQAAGFPNAYNVADGFEGAVDAEGHRGVASGWKAEGLPWRQR